MNKIKSQTNSNNQPAGSDVVEFQKSVLDDRQIDPTVIHGRSDININRTDLDEAHLEPLVRGESCRVQFDPVARGILAEFLLDVELFDTGRLSAGVGAVPRAAAAADLHHRLRVFEAARVVESREGMIQRRSARCCQILADVDVG